MATFGLFSFFRKVFQRSSSVFQISSCRQVGEKTIFEIEYMGEGRGMISVDSRFVKYLVDDGKYSCKAVVHKEAIEIKFQDDHVTMIQVNSRKVVKIRRHGDCIEKFIALFKKL